MEISEKKAHGKYYTPKYIVDYILGRVFNGRELDGLKVCDPAAGDGAFLIPVIKMVTEGQIVGFDSDDALSSLDYKLIHGNSTNKKFLAPYLKQFDAVVGNPPYVRLQNISEKERVYLKDWEFTSGATDLYIPFIELGLELLKPGGVLGYIVANSFFKNRCGEKLLDYLFNNQYVTEVVDFQHHHLFSASAYTCILLCCKQKNSEVRIRLPKDCFGEHLKNGTINLHNDLETYVKPYPVNRATLLVRKNDESFIEACEGQQYKLKDAVRISVGLATLADSVFFLKEQTNIEPEALKPCIKISRLHHEGDIKKQQRFIIFPYDIVDNKAIPWSEKKLQSYPKVYAYLLTHQDQLRARDRGRVVKYSWFHYGRSQGITTLTGRKIFVQPIIKHPSFIICEDEALLFLSGYAIFEKNQQLDLKTLKTILESDLFNRYLHIKGKDYSGGWKACTKNFLGELSIPHFTTADKGYLSSADKENKELIIRSKYGL